MSRYDYEYEWDPYYCYPNSHVLKNNLNIHEAGALADAEREITAVRLGQISKSPVHGKFDLEHLCNIHRAIFHDVFPWAGELRTVNIAKGNQFCLFQHLETYASPVFSKLKTENFLIDTPVVEMPERLTFYLSEINVLHPFRDGNGRAQRVFIEYLAQYAGCYVDFSTVDAKEMIEASALSFAKKYDVMNAMFQRIVSLITVEEQQDFQRKIGLITEE